MPEMKKQRAGARKYSTSAMNSVPFYNACVGSAWYIHGREETPVGAFGELRVHVLKDLVE